MQSTSELYLNFFTRPDIFFCVAAAILSAILLLSSTSNAQSTSTVMPAYPAHRSTTKVSGVITRPIFTPHWASEIGLGISRNLDAYADYTTKFDGTVAYLYSRRVSFYLNVVYKAIMNRDYTYYEDNLRYDGFEDMLLGYSFKNFYRFTRNQGLSFTLEASAPTSKTSQEATQYGALAPDLSYRNKINSYFTFGTSHILRLSAHEYETADVAGTRPNSPFGMENYFLAKISFNRFIVWTNTAGVYSYTNYDGTNGDLQWISTKLSAEVLKDLTTEIYYTWKNEIITNNSLFDEDRITAGMNVRYAF